METLNTRTLNPIEVWSFGADVRIGQGDSDYIEEREVIHCNPADIPALCRMLYAEAGLAWPEPAWIKVADRLPEKSGRYIVQWCGGWMCDYFYDEHITDSSWSEGLILAWQPLPAAYKEDT